MKIAVIGSNGQLGSDITAELEKRGHSAVPLNHKDIEISDIDSVMETLKKIRPDAVVNTAAMHHVEKCEDQPVQAFNVNAIGSRNLAQVCNEVDAFLVHVSTDYVFDGLKGKPYVESDVPRPLNVYANSKLSGEHFVSAIARRYAILRVSGIYGINPCRAKGHNFVDLMLKLAGERDEIRVVDDEWLTPTFTGDIAAQLGDMLDSECESGLFHVTAGGSCSWYEFAREIFNLANVNVNLNKAAPGEFAIKVNRPKYSVLQNRHLADLGLDNMPHWKSGLGRYLKLKLG